jgi:hypothetical protein
LLYHIVCPAKYRRVIFDAEVDTVLKDVCSLLSAELIREEGDIRQVIR